MRRDHSAARSLLGLLALSLVVSLLLVGVGGEYASKHLPSGTAARWASGGSPELALEETRRIVMGSQASQETATGQLKNKNIAR